MECWRPVHSAKPTNADSIAKLLGYYKRNQGHLFNFGHIGIPDEEQIIETIARAKHSAPGEDGVPFGTYRTIASTTATSLRNIAVLFSQQEPCLAASPIPLPPGPPGTKKDLKRVNRVPCT